MRLIRWYNPENSKSGMLAEYASHSDEIRGVVTAIAREWARGSDLKRHPYKELRGHQAGLFELELDVRQKPTRDVPKPKTKHFRALGFIESSSGDYILLTAFEKTAGVASYGRPCDRARRLMRKVQRNYEHAPLFPFQ